MVVEYDYSEAYNAGAAYASKLNKVGLAMIDPNIIPPAPPSPTPSP